ncbi:MAG TPA: alpha/beta hydrolase, partial [Gammaproteobacteria bacterium]|nr:alpha/beta hydrolase [Gammaproteobacteria bacterium]
MYLRKAYCPALVLLSMLLLSGCSGLQVLNAVTPNSGYVRHADISYGENLRQKLDVYVPNDVENSAPVVLFFYGGAWKDGNKEAYAYVAQALTSQGYVTVIADYRLYPEVIFPAFIKDGANAVAWVHNNIADYGGNPQQVFIMGHSAGAHIAATLVLDESYLQAHGGSNNWFAGFIGLSGPYDFELTSDLLRGVFGPPADYPETQPINFVDGGNPPTLLMHGKDDERVHTLDTKLLTQKIRAAGGPVTMKLYEDTGHIWMIASL